MTYPDPDDVGAVGGAHPGTQSQEEVNNTVRIEIDRDKDLGEVSKKILDAAEWHMESFSDSNRSPKYAVDPTVSYYGNGSLSLIPRLGKFIFASSVNEANRGAFRLDQGESSFYSSMGSTTLGSLEIDTVDGQVLNPLSPQQPSTNYSPTKPWIKKLFPTFSTKNFTTIAVLEIINTALLTALDKGANVPASENIESKKDVIDVATIIVDNQEIEDRILGND